MTDDEKQSHRDRLREKLGEAQYKEFLAEYTGFAGEDISKEEADRQRDFGQKFFSPEGLLFLMAGDKIVNSCLATFALTLQQTVYRRQKLNADTIAVLRFLRDTLTSPQWTERLAADLAQEN